jgi:hypothetical protein
MATATLPGPATTGTIGVKTIWIGRVVSAIPVLLLVVSGALKLAGGEEMLRSWTGLGYPASVLVPIGLVEIGCAVLYAVPRTAVLGAVLVTGYLGGAVATHLRLLQPVFPTPAIVGALAWLGLYLRDPRIRALLPLRRDA